MRGCDHFYLWRRGGACPDCGATFTAGRPAATGNVNDGYADVRAVLRHHDATARAARRAAQKAERSCDPFAEERAASLRAVAREAELTAERLVERCPEALYSSSQARAAS